MFWIKGLSFVLLIHLWMALQKSSPEKEETTWKTRKHLFTVLEGKWTILIISNNGKFSHLSTILDVNEALIRSFNTFCRIFNLWDANFGPFFLFAAGLEATQALLFPLQKHETSLNTLRQTTIPSYQLPKTAMALKDHHRNLYTNPGSFSFIVTSASTSSNSRSSSAENQILSLRISKMLASWYHKPPRLRAMVRSLLILRTDFPLAFMEVKRQQSLLHPSLQFTDSLVWDAAETLAGHADKESVMYIFGKLKKHYRFCTWMVATEIICGLKFAPSSNVWDLVESAIEMNMPNRICSQNMQQIDASRSSFQKVSDDGSTTSEASLPSNEIHSSAPPHKLTRTTKKKRPAPQPPSHPRQGQKSVPSEPEGVKVAAKRKAPPPPIAAQQKLDYTSKEKQKSKQIKANMEGGKLPSRGNRGLIKRVKSLFRFSKNRESLKTRQKGLKRSDVMDKALMEATPLVLVTFPDLDQFGNSYFKALRSLKLKTQAGSKDGCKIFTTTMSDCTATCGEGISLKGSQEVRGGTCHLSWKRVSCRAVSGCTSDLEKLQRGLGLTRPAHWPIEAWKHIKIPDEKYWRRVQFGESTCGTFETSSYNAYSPGKKGKRKICGDAAYYDIGVKIRHVSGNAHCTTEFQVEPVTEEC